MIDVEFPRGSLPELNTALEFTVTVDGKDVTVLAEVAQQLGDSRVRAVCMKPTDGLTRGTAGAQHRPRHPACRSATRTLGHVWNVWGDVLDADPADYADIERWDIHRPAPHFDTLEPSTRACSRPASRSSTCSPRTCRAARSACSVAPASARPC